MELYQDRKISARIYRVIILLMRAKFFGAARVKLLWIVEQKLPTIL